MPIRRQAGKLVGMTIPPRLSAILWGVLAFVLVVLSSIQNYRIREPLEAVRQAADLFPVLLVFAASFLCSTAAIYAVRRAFGESNRKSDDSGPAQTPELN